MGIFDKRILQSNNSHVFKNGDSLELFEHFVNTFVKKYLDYLCLFIIYRIN